MTVSTQRVLVYRTHCDSQSSLPITEGDGKAASPSGRRQCAEPAPGAEQVGGSSSCLVCRVRCSCEGPGSRHKCPRGCKCTRVLLYFCSGHGPMPCSVFSYKNCIYKRRIIVKT